MRYSNTVLNKVVQNYMVLEKKNDLVYFSQLEDDEYTKEKRYLLVLKVEGLFIADKIYSQKYIDDTNLLELAFAKASNYIKMINNSLESDDPILNMYIRVFKELGYDAAPLIKAREERLKKQEEKEKAERLERKRIEEEQEKEDAEREKTRLLEVKKSFLAGGKISSNDFIHLCKMEGIQIPIRTIGTLNERVRFIELNGVVWYEKIRGKRKPNLEGCHNAVKIYREQVKVKK